VSPKNNRVVIFGSVENISCRVTDTDGCIDLSVTLVNSLTSAFENRFGSISGSFA